MTLPVITREAARRLDRRAEEEYGLPGLVLMENAGRGAAEKLLSLGCAGPAVICCGAGNNGGDGLVMARHLDLRGVPVRVLLWGDPQRLTPDAAVNLRIVQKCGLPLALNPDPSQLNVLLDGADWIVDALLGTGARGEPRPPLDAVIRQLNVCPAPKLAVDLPSGFDCDAGPPAHNAIRADHTCTLVAHKPGFLVPGALSYTGQIHVIDIGAPRRLVEQILSESAHPAV